jgi:hypothetical protein
MGEEEAYMFYRFWMNVATILTYSKIPLEAKTAVTMKNTV